jgi:hypothetical protein
MKRGVKVDSRTVIRGDPRENAGEHLWCLIHSLTPSNEQHEIAVVTHRRFIDNILRRCKWYCLGKEFAYGSNIGGPAPSQRDWANVETHAYIVTTIRNLMEFDISELPTDSHAWLTEAQTKTHETTKNEKNDQNSGREELPLQKPEKPSDFQSKPVWCSGIKRQKLLEENGIDDEVVTEDK